MKLNKKPVCGKNKDLSQSKVIFQYKKFFINLFQKLLKNAEIIIIKKQICGLMFQNYIDFKIENKI